MAGKEVVVAVEVVVMVVVVVVVEWNHVESVFGGVKSSVLILHLERLDYTWNDEEIGPTPNLAHL